MQNHPTIVISAYNRPASLQRLLHSLTQAVYPAHAVNLVISIDKSDDVEVKALATAFEWKQGTKKIISQTEHLGLKAHILRCGELTQEYNSIILLEDDLLVSPYFYEYATRALACYESDPAIAGISLYNYQITESGFCPFTAIDDGSDVYFMQVASSWGQLWTKAQWHAFTAWFSTHPEIETLHHVPAYLQQWGPHSWKKHFIHYLVNTNKFFVFPRLSLSTNFADSGTHTSKTNIFQVPLQTASKNYALKARSTSPAQYDAWFEMLPDCLSKLNPRLQNMDYSVDLYATKIPSQLGSKYILSSRAGKDPLLSFGKALFPAEANVVMNLKGQGISLYETKNAVLSHEQMPLHERPQQHKESQVISVIIPVETPDSLALETTLDSVMWQGYAHTECVIVATPAAMAMVQEKTGKYALRTTIINTASVPLSELLMKGFNSVGMGLVTWIMPGSTFIAGAFDKAVFIFESYASVNWIRGIEEEYSTLAEYARLNVRRYRLTPGEAYQRLENKELNAGTELDFFKHHCVKKLTKPVSPDSLFFDLISHYQVTIVVLRLGIKQTGAATPVSAEKRQQILARYVQLKKRRSWPKAVFSFLLNLPVFNSEVRQWYGAAFDHLPDVLRYDATHQTFYFHKY